MTIFFTTHRLEEAERLCDRVCHPQHDDALVVSSLGVFDADEPVGVGNGTGNGERGEVEIDVTPAQPAKFAPPSTGGCGYINEAAEVLVVIGAYLERAFELFFGGPIMANRPALTASSGSSKKCL